MKIKFKQTSLSLMLSVMTLLAPSAYAEVTAPVGYVKLTFAAQSDTPFSLPMNRPKVFAGKVDTITSNEITIASEDLTASAYVYNALSQKEHYYVLFTGGDLEGRSFDVTTNGTDTITVAQEGVDDLASIIGATATATFEIRPHWTLNTLFPDGAGFPVSADRTERKGMILIKPTDSNGINHSANKAYKYVTGEGWIDDFQLFSSPDNDVVLKRDIFYTLRNEEALFTKNIVGDVPNVSARISLSANLIEQDSYIAFSFPQSLTLDSSGLATNPDFKSSTSLSVRDGDVLYVYDKDATGYNFGSSKGYFYVDGEGWYDNFQLFGGLVPGTTTLNSIGRGFIIRKSGETEAGMLKSKIDVPYLPFTTN